MKRTLAHRFPGETALMVLLLAVLGLTTTLAAATVRRPAAEDTSSPAPTLHDILDRHTSPDAAVGAVMAVPGVIDAHLHHDLLHVELADPDLGPLTLCLAHAEGRPDRPWQPVGCHDQHGEDLHPRDVPTRQPTLAP